MTKDEAYILIKMSLRSIRHPKLYQAVQIALKALAWESAHEKMLDLTREKHD